eukprot:COSAG03_NODE_9422_length_720_cov_10.766506_1_plen_123_part_10
MDFARHSEWRGHRYALSLSLALSLYLSLSISRARSLPLACSTSISLCRSLCLSPSHTRACVTVVALKFTPALEEIDGSDNSSIALRLPSDQALRVSVAVSFGEQHEEANISSRARSWAADMDG